MILIVTHQRGFEADHVIDALRLRHAPLFRFNTDCGGQGDGFAVTIGAEPRSVLNCDGRVLNLSDVTAAWFHQPPPDARDDLGSSFPAHLRLESFRAAYDWIFEQVSAPWLNCPVSVYTAANKMRQLIVAKSAGLRVPDTLVANSAAAVRRFATKHAGNVVVKNLATPWYVTSEGTVAAFTKRLETDVLDDASAIEFAPLVYQERLERALDVRAVVVGPDVFSAAISPKSMDSQDDIRRIPLTEARYDPLGLPPEIQTGLQRLMSVFGLQYCSADFAVTDKGAWYFLDLNATGAFLWVEKLAGFPISARIADYLASRC